MNKRCRQDELALGDSRTEPNNLMQQGRSKRPEIILGKIARDQGVSTPQVEAAARLLDEGNTLPFIARYRKEATGSLDEGQLRGIEAGIKALDALEEQRKSTISKLKKLVRIGAQPAGHHFQFSSDMHACSRPRPPVLHTFSG